MNLDRKLSKNIKYVNKYIKKRMKKTKPDSSLNPQTTKPISKKQIKTTLGMVIL